MGQRREVSTIAALVVPLDGPARLYARHVRGSVHGAHVIVELRSCRPQIGQPLVVIWGRLNARRAKPVLIFVAAHPDDYAIEWLPPYGPELNPEELCNGAVKRDRLSALPGSVDGLHQLARRSFRRLGRRPDLLARFFRHAGLSVTRLP